MKYLQRFLILPALIALLMAGCEKETTDELIPKDNSDRIIINNDVSELSERITYHLDYVMSMNDENGFDNKKSFKNSTVIDDEDVIENYVLQLRAEVEPLMYNGFELRATHVKIRGIYAYVSYNVEGATYLGGVEVFDVSDTEHPELVSQALFTDTDVSSMDISEDGTKLYLATATNLNENPEFEKPAVLEVVELDDGLLTANTTRLGLRSYVATDVTIVDDIVYVTSGDNGGLTVLDANDLSIEIAYYELDDARSIDTNGDKLVVLQGMPARLSVYNAADGSFINSFDIGGADIPESKSMVEVHGDIALAATGTQGMKIIDLNTGEELDNMPRPTIPEGAYPPDYVTNGVSVNSDLGFDLALVANGASGVHVAQLLDDSWLYFLGSMDFNSSTNFVEAKNNVIFVATGFGGLKILEIVYYDPETGDYLTICDYDEDGVPHCLTPDEIICETLIPNLSLHLPERQNNLENHPEYFSDYPTTVYLEEEAEVTITFVSEGAGYTNVLGYYYYDADNPPASVDDLDNLTVIFPNASAAGSGGNLTPGNTMSLGTFPANTVIGYFLLSNGWNNGEITTGLYQIYSNTEFNTDGFQQSLLLYDIECAKIILAFEDIEISGGDKDFNDVIFTVKAEPETAINTDNFVQISGVYDN